MSYIVSKGIQYRYVYRGQIFIFLYIPDDLAIVFYHICMPNLDILEDDENRFHCTAVIQVFAFVFYILRAAPSPSPLSWHDDIVAGFDIWAVEYDHVRSKIPVSFRKVDYLLSGQLCSRLVRVADHVDRSRQN